MRRPNLPPGCDPDSILLSFPVAREHAGQRLDRFIQSRIPRLSRTRAKRIVKSCAYRANGTLRKASERVRFGDTILLVRPKFQEPETPRDFEVIHEDAEVLVVNKPAGLPVHPSATYHRNTLTYLLRERFGDHAPKLAHRLDRETSGIVVCAKNHTAERKLKACFAERRVKKTYLAIVRGALLPREGTVRLPMARAREGLHLLMEIREDGLPAVTEYAVLEQGESHGLVQLRPRTGRQHQLRLHLAALGHPIDGDKLYGPEGARAFVEYIETGMTEDLRRRLGHDRHALHAAQIELEHPADPKKSLRVSAPMPPDMRTLCKTRVAEHVAGF